MIETESIKRLLVPGNFTFVVMTDRDDLDEQLYKTFVGCGAADEQTPRASSGRQLQTLLTENHRYVFSLIHKFNQDVHPDAPYSRRDDIIVISDEAYRTQAGKLARNMRLALPNASFIGFTGTPLFTYDHLIRRIFGGYVSRYDFRGFDRIAALRDATNAVYTSDEAKRRVELMARQVFARCKALLMEPAAFTSAERHDHIAAINQKLQERRDTSDVTALLKELHQIVNEAIRTQETGTDHAEGLTVDLSQLDVQQWRDEFAQVKRTQVLRQDIRALVEQKLQQMLRTNPQRRDFDKTSQAIIVDYNREKDRITGEETFTRLLDLAHNLDAEQQRAAQEGLSEHELALFDLLYQPRLSQVDREQLKQASWGFLAALRELLKPMENWTPKEPTPAEVKVFILDRRFETLPDLLYSADETQAAATRIYAYIWQRSADGSLFPHDQAA